MAHPRGHGGSGSPRVCAELPRIALSNSARAAVAPGVRGDVWPLRGCSTRLPRRYRWFDTTPASSSPQCRARPSDRRCRLGARVHARRTRTRGSLADSRSGDRGMKPPSSGRSPRASQAGAFWTGEYSYLQTVDLRGSTRLLGARHLRHHDQNRPVAAVVLNRPTSRSGDSRPAICVEVAVPLKGWSDHDESAVVL